MTNNNELVMKSEADSMTNMSQDEAREARLESWLKVVRDVEGIRPNAPVDPRKPFASARIFLSSLLNDLRKGSFDDDYLWFDAGFEQFIEILAFDFFYSYSRFEWTGMGTDPNDSELFEETADSDFLDESDGKDEICNMLREDLLAGAAQAKIVGSDTYVGWRELLVDYQYKYHEFTSGCNKEGVKKFWDRIVVVAQKLSVDTLVFNHIQSLHAKDPHKNKTAQKVPKSAKK